MPDAHTIRYFRGKLPHWLVAEHSFFITFCRKGQRAIPTCRDPRRPGATSPASWFDSFVQADRLLDSMPTPSGSLAHPAVASMLCNNFDWLRKRGWRIWTACIMPSHVHCVMRNTEGRGGSLLEDLGLFKNFTGREANRLLGLQGSFWQREVFDRWCRNGEDWFRFFCYTVQNPVQAGAVQDWRNWPWTIVDPEVEALLEGGMPGS